MSYTEARSAECPASTTPLVETLVVPLAKDIGAFEVRRALPASARQMVGPFIFLDQMGPVTLEPPSALDVRPHPHIGLSTLTWLFDGAITHRDSLGSALDIRPGEVNWMTAGRGVVHSERSPQEARGRPSALSGMQAWIALPREHEECDPAFVHLGVDRVPRMEGEGIHLSLIAGDAFGLRSPLETFGETFYADAALTAGARLELPVSIEERAVYVVEGQVEIDGARYPAGRLVVLRPRVPVTVSATAGARCILLGGDSADGPRHLWWNLVSSSRERLEQAKRDWAAGRFPTVPGDEEEFIPLPDA